MLLAKQTMVFPLTSLGNPFIKGDHLPLGNVTWFSAALEPFMIFVSQKGFLDAFEGFVELPWYCGSTELVLVLSVPRNHHEDVDC